MKLVLACIFILFSKSIFAEKKSVVENDSKNNLKKTVSVQVIYQKHCAQCHGHDRLGAMGPALLPENLSRLRKNDAHLVIANGREATQMPAFLTLLDKQSIAALVEWIYTPLKHKPVWSVEHIKSTQTVFYDVSILSNKPLFNADPMNLFIVVELGDHHATLLDGDTFEPLHRFKTHYALHGGPKYSPEGRFVYFASRDGWISKYDIYTMNIIAEVRVGINTRNLAVSSDGRYAIAANYLPKNLVILNTDDLSPVTIIDVMDRQGKESRVSAVYNAPPRNSFIAALKDVKEVWEISYEGDSKDKKVFPIKRYSVTEYIDDFFFDQDYRLLFGASREGEGLILSLDQGRVIGRLDVQGMPHLGSGITWDYQGTQVLATPNLKEGIVSIIDMKTWKTIKRIATKGPGFFMRSHENSRFAWVDVFFGPHKDLVHVIDKTTLEIVKTLKPAPGKTAAHVEFTKNGSHALLSVWDIDGALVIYDANKLTEIKRLPMVKPSGKYNVYNKTHYSRGTSH